AVSRAVLDVLAQEGIRFTILAPAQCARTRALAAKEAPMPAWTETPDATVDPTHPYLVRLNEGRSIAVFFYNGPISRAVAFEGLLNSGQEFGERLVGNFTNSAAAQLTHIATDGESYGHHHKHGEMALSDAMHRIEDGHDATLTNYAEFLEKFPPA